MAHNEKELSKKRKQLKEELSRVRSSRPDVVFAYSRKEVLADGSQVMVPPQVASEAGIKVPVYMTSQVWERYVKVPEGMEGYQDTDGRLWDILWMFRTYAQSSKSPVIMFEYLCELPGDPQINEKRFGDTHKKTVKLKAVAGPKDIDQPEMAITILLPNQD